MQYFSNCMGVWSLSHMQVLASPLLSVHNIKYTRFAGPLPLKAFSFICLFLKQWCRDVASGIDRHPDRTEIYFRLQIQGSPRLIHCSCTFWRSLNHPYISFFHLLVNGFCVTISVLFLANCYHLSISIVHVKY